MIKLRSVLIAGALVSMGVPAAAFADDCNFVAGDTVLQERGASDQRIAQFLGDLGASRSGQTINTRIFSEQVAVTMVERHLVQNVPAACQNQLAANFLTINGLSGSMTDAQFAARVRSTGFRLPTMAAPAQATPPAQPAATETQSRSATVPVPAAQPASPAQPARLSSADRAALDSLTAERAQLRGQISELRNRPFITSNDRQLLNSLQGNLDAINTRIEALTTLSTRLRTDVDGLRRDVTGLRTDVDAQDNRLGALTWVRWAAGLGVAGLILGIFNWLQNRKRKSEIKTFRDVTSRIDDELTSLTGVVQNATGQLGVADMVIFDHDDMAELKSLPEGERKFVRVLINGSGERQLKVQFARVKGGQYICLTGVDGVDNETLISNPLAFVRENYRNGHLVTLKAVA